MRQKPAYNAQRCALPAPITNRIAPGSRTLQSNQLTGGVPSTLGKLTSLTQLDISNNFIGTFPPTLCKLASLASARIAGNNITNPAVFDPWLCANLTKLTYVDISNNPLGSLPMSLQNLPNLQQLCVPFPPSATAQ